MGWFGNSAQRGLTRSAKMLRGIDMLMAQGHEFGSALRAARVREAEYIDKRAEYEDLPAERIRRLYVEADPSTPLVDPSAYIGGGLRGLCPVCGQYESFVDFDENLRESGRCLSCDSNNRQRQMALIIRLCLGLPGIGELTPPPELRVHNTESTGVIHKKLREHAGYTFSEYWGPQYVSGETVDGVRHEDMQSLSFSDDSLDLLLSSHVLEHMPHPYQAHAEIFRVLKPGGRHIFTVPFHSAYEDDVRARVEGGEIIYSGEKLYHGDPIRPDEGVLVWTIFGTQMLDKLREIGFNALQWKFSAPQYGILGAAFVFDARKPDGSASPAPALSSRALSAIGYYARGLKMWR